MRFFRQSSPGAKLSFNHTHCQPLFGSSLKALFGRAEIARVLVEIDYSGTKLVWFFTMDVSCVPIKNINDCPVISL